MVPLLTESVVGIVSFVVLYLWKEKPFFISFISALLLAYLPQYFNGLEKKGGNHWRVGCLLVVVDHFLCFMNMILLYDRHFKIRISSS